jgi:hypothetical protein
LFRKVARDLATLKDIKPVVGEADYNEQYKALFSKLLNFSSYNNELRPNEVDNE